MEKFKEDSFQNFGGLNQKVSQYITGEREALQLVNVDFTVPGSWTKAPGSTYYSGATVAGRITGLYEFEKLSGFSQIIFTANTNAYYFDGVVPTAFRSSLTNGALFDFVTFVDTLFMANGTEFFKWDGSQSYNFSIPTNPTPSAGLIAAGTPGFSGSFNYAVGYLNTNGFFGPVSSEVNISTAGTQIALSGFTFPLGFGITAAVVYRTSPSGSDLFRIGYVPFGNATFVDTGLALSAQLAPDAIYFTLAPKYLEIFQNSLFMSGFPSTPGSSITPSSVVYSESGTPENILENNNFETRTNDGDIVRGMKAYQQSLYIFKERSFHRLTGDNSSNYVLNEISDQYGCLSNRCIAVYEDVLLFLDRKGICEWNGAGVRIVSTPVEPIFLNMNLTAARDNAVAIHNRLRNEVWFGIPVDGATLNNMTVVYDYYSKAWTTFQGFNPSSLAVIRGPFDQSRAFYGSYEGSVHFSSASIFSHNGTPMTFKVQTQYYNQLGQSITSQWRRLFTNTSVVGATLTVRFRTDNEDDIQDERYVSTGAFQSRLEFGIPSKNLSIEYEFVSASLPIRIDGFTLESRLQRKV